MAMRQTTCDAIVAVAEQFMDAFRRQDAAAVAHLYTEHGQLFLPGIDVLTGRQAIQEFYQSGMDMGITAVRLETVEVEDYGETALAVGRYTMDGADGQVLDRGNYLSILKQADGQWQYHRDIGTTSFPQPASS